MGRSGGGIEEGGGDAGGCVDEGLELGESGGAAPRTGGEGEVVGVVGGEG